MIAAASKVSTTCVLEQPQRVQTWAGFIYFSSQAMRFKRKQTGIAQLGAPSLKLHKNIPATGAVALPLKAPRVLDLKALEYVHRPDSAVISRPIAWVQSRPLRRRRSQMIHLFSAQKSPANVSTDAGAASRRTPTSQSRSSVEVSRGPQGIFLVRATIALLGMPSAVSPTRRGTTSFPIQRGLSWISVTTRSHFR